jgi:hypothetical protein
MSRLMMLLFATALGMSMLVSPLIVAPEEEKDEEQPARQEGEQWRDAQVDGLVYKIQQIEGKSVLTVYDTEVLDSIQVYIANPALQPLIQNGTACVGRYVVATGVRTGPYTLDAQGLMVDMSKACGTPPK